MTVLKETVEQMIPDDWESNIDYDDVKYVEYWWTGRKHCNDARPFRDVTGAVVYVCRHERGRHNAL